MTRTHPFLIALVVALAATIVGCGETPADHIEPYAEAGEEALRFTDPIVDDWTVDLDAHGGIDHVTLDDFTNPRDAALAVRDYDAFDVSGVEFTEGGWALHPMCGSAYAKAEATADGNANRTCRATEHRLAWAEFLTIDNVNTTQTELGCFVKLSNWYVCH